LVKRLHQSRVNKLHDAAGYIISSR
jgi:hypothetical protein